MADHVSAIPDGFRTYATSPQRALCDYCRYRPVAFMPCQFHPEVHHTPKGAILLQNFIRIAGFPPRLGQCKPTAIPPCKPSAIRSAMKTVLCGLSGGVDRRRQPPFLIHQAIGDQLSCVFVDHGLLRENEAEEVLKLFRDHYKIKPDLRPRRRPIF